MESRIKLSNRENEKRERPRETRPEEASRLGFCIVADRRLIHHLQRREADSVEAAPGPVISGAFGGAKERRGFGRWRVTPSIVPMPLFCFPFYSLFPFFSFPFPFPLVLSAIVLRVCTDY